MEGHLGVLLATAITVGVVHTLLGPDHYLPFVVMAKARSWNVLKTMWITFICGMGHVLSSVAIGGVGIAMGVGVGKLENLESFRGDIAAWILFIFGIGYLFWGIWKIYIRKPHAHLGMGHMVQEESNSQTHQHGPMNKIEKAATLTPWILFVVFILGPCEALIPILMYPAAKLSSGGVILVSIVFSVATIATMMVSTALLLYGVKIVKTNVIDKYAHAIAGATIALSAGAILFLGL